MNIQTDLTEEKTPFIRTVYDILELFVLAVCIVFVIFTFTVRLCRVSGPSMENTLYDGELLLTSDLFYTPRAGDIVVFHQTGDPEYTYNELIVKRVIATEGQFVKLEKDGVYVSEDSDFTEDERLDESTYAKLDIGYMLDYFGVIGKTIQVPKDSLFVLGDNRNHSTDSRSSTVGFVDTRRIVGRVIFRVTPLDRLGSVE